MKVELFDFDLPDDLIALRPASPRDEARQLILNADGSIDDDSVGNLAAHLRAGDVLVFNNTRVIPARLSAKRVGRGDTQPDIELTLHQRVDAGQWLAFAKPGRKLNPGDRIGIADGFSAHVEEKNDGGEVHFSFNVSGAALDEMIARHGVMPLPPYIASKRATDARDSDDYQTIFAEHDGAVAAPTASLHFTDDMMASIKAKGVTCVFVTLHVGAGTFLPVKADDTSGHKIHSEWGEIGADVAQQINQAREAGGRVIAVGTTSLRLLESAADDGGRLAPWSGATDIFITPGYRFKVVDGLMTNFHLPKSTLFMLVSALCGLDIMQKVYAHAIKKGYRFYSYGDSSLLWPQQS